MEKKTIEALVEKTQKRQRRTTDLTQFDPTLKEMMTANISLPVILEWLEGQNKVTTLPALRRYIRRVFGEDFYDNFLVRNGWHRTKQNGKRVSDSYQAPTPVPSTKPAVNAPNRTSKTALSTTNTGTSVERLKKLTQGSFNPDQFNEDE